MARKSFAVCCHFFHKFFLAMWERYCRGVSAIVYVLDASAHDSMDIAKKELFELLEKESLKNIPLLVLANKNDVKGALGVNEVIEKMYRHIYIIFTHCI